MSRKERRQNLRLQKRLNPQEMSQRLDQTIIIPSWLKVARVGEIGLPRAVEAVHAAKDWAAQFGPVRNIAIMPFTDEHFTDEKGRQMTVVEKSEPGVIYLGKIGDVRNVILHSMTHASGADPILLDEPLIDKDGDMILGYQGLDVLVRYSDGTESPWGLLEEGMCERNASYFPGYFSRAKSYTALRRFTRERLPREQFPQAHTWAKTSDVPSFVQAILGLKSREDVTVDHIGQVMELYDRIWNDN